MHADYIFFQEHIPFALGLDAYFAPSLPSQHSFCRRTVHLYPAAVTGFAGVTTLFSVGVKKHAV